MKAGGLSVDIGQVMVVPIEVATAVVPVLGAGVRVGAHLEPTEKHTQCCRFTQKTSHKRQHLRYLSGLFAFSCLIHFVCY